MKTMRIVAISAFALVALSGAGEAGDARSACKADYKRYCSNVQLGGGRVMKCLKENEASLSQPCKDALAEAKEKAQEKQQGGGQ